MADLRYPIGPFVVSEQASAEQVAAWIDGIEALPERLRALVASMSEEELEREYRSGGWNARQVVHHLVDSHLNSFTRFKLALTEDRPTIKPYDEARFVELPDALGCGLDETLDLLAHLHRRWVVLLRGLSERQLARTFYHPEPERLIPLWETVGMYEWHGRHHFAHIESVQGVRS